MASTVRRSSRGEYRRHCYTMCHDNTCSNSRKCYERHCACDVFPSRLRAVPRAAQPTPGLSCRRHFPKATETTQNIYILARLE